MLLLTYLFELEDLNQTLNLEEFTEAMALLIKKMTPSDRHRLLFGEKEHKKTEFSFKVRFKYFDHF